MPAEHVDAESFDHVCLCQLLGPIPNPHPFPDEVARVLKPGGIFFVGVPTLHNPLASLYALRDFRSFWYQVRHLYYFDDISL